MELFEKLYEVLDNVSGDVDKFNNGNKSAGTRIRKAMQEVKSIAQEVRVEVQNKKNSN